LFYGQTVIAAHPQSLAWKNFEDVFDTDPSDTLKSPGAHVALILPVRLSRLPSLQSFQSKDSFFRSRTPTVSCDRSQVHSRIRIHSVKLAKTRHYCLIHVLRL